MSPILSSFQTGLSFIPIFTFRHTPPPDPREKLATMSDAMAELILELLAKDPDARPRRATDVAARLQAIYEAAR